MTPRIGEQPEPRSGQLGLDSAEKFYGPKPEPKPEPTLEPTPEIEPAIVPEVPEVVKDEVAQEQIEKTVEEGETPEEKEFYQHGRELVDAINNAIDKSVRKPFDRDSFVKRFAVKDMTPEELVAVAQFASEWKNKINELKVQLDQSAEGRSEREKQFGELDGDLTEGINELAERMETQIQKRQEKESQERLDREELAKLNQEFQTTITEVENNARLQGYCGERLKVLDEALTSFSTEATVNLENITNHFKQELLKHTNGEDFDGLEKKLVQLRDVEKSLNSEREKASIFSRGRIKRQIEQNLAEQEELRTKIEKYRPIKVDLDLWQRKYTKEILSAHSERFMNIALEKKELQNKLVQVNNKLQTLSSEAAEKYFNYLGKKALVEQEPPRESMESETMEEVRKRKAQAVQEGYAEARRRKVE